VRTNIGICHVAFDVYVVAKEIFGRVTYAFFIDPCGPCFAHLNHHITAPKQSLTHQDVIWQREVAAVHHWALIMNLSKFETIVKEEDVTKLLILLNQRAMTLCSLKIMYNCAFLKVHVHRASLLHREFSGSKK